MAFYQIITVIIQNGGGGFFAAIGNQNQQKLPDTFDIPVSASMGGGGGGNTAGASIQVQKLYSCSRVAQGVNSIDINLGPKIGPKIGPRCKIEKTVLKLA